MTFDMIRSIHLNTGGWPRVDIVAANAHVRNIAYVHITVGSAMRDNLIKRDLVEDAVKLRVFMIDFNPVTSALTVWAENRASVFGALRRLLSLSSKIG